MDPTSCIMFMFLSICLPKLVLLKCYRWIDCFKLSFLLTEGFKESLNYSKSVCEIFTLGPQMVKGEEAGTAASLMVAMLGIGLGLGAFLSNFFVQLI